MIVVSRPRFVSGWFLTSLIMAIIPVGILSWSSQVSAQAVETSGPSVRSVVVGKRQFELPVDIDPSAEPPQELQLFVSGPGSGEPAIGMNNHASLDRPESPWQIHDRKPYPSGHFDVVSHQDGVYWFSVRSLDVRGSATPATLQPHLQVIVDTQVPKMIVQAAADERGRVRGRVQINDRTAIRQLLIQYHTDQATRWIQLEASSISTDPNSSSAQDTRTFQFHPTVDWRRLTIRVSAEDSAGNIAHKNEMIERPRMAGQDRGHRMVSTNDGQTDSVAKLFRQFDRVDAQVASGPINRGPITRNMSAIAPRGYTGLAVAAMQATEQVPAPAGTPGAGDELPAPATPEQITAGRAVPETNLNAPKNTLLPSISSPPVTSPGSSGTSAESSPWQGATDKDPRWDPARVMSTPRTVEQAMRPLTTRPRQLPTTTEAAPYRASRVGQSADETSNASQSESAEKTSRPDTPGSVPKNIYERASQKAPVRHSDSPRFSLEYELEAVGSNGADAIELWGSVDGGVSWTKWGEDPDRASPFDIETKGDGVFGFRIVVIGGNGLNSPAPRSGESADIVVVVDQQAPRTRIRGARYGEDDFVGCLVIQYECEDEFLTSRPITLAYSPTREGPWTTIAGGLRNDGEYIWPADPGLPPQMYLRVTATDLAGNVGSYRLDTPINTQGLAPRARIRGFQPLSNQLPTGPPAGQTAVRPRAAFK